MRKHPIWYLIIAIAVLIVPTIIYLCFLVPQLTERYNVLMSSAGVIGGSGFYGASKIPTTWKYSGIFKTAVNSFTVLIVGTLVNEFAMQIIFLIALFVACFLTYKILMEKWKDGKRRKDNEYIAEQIARSIDKTSK